MAPTLIKIKKAAPTTLSKSWGQWPKDLVRGVRGPAEHPYSHTKVIDMIQGTATLPQTHRTPPWCQQPHARAGWPFGGVFVLSATASKHTSGVEGVWMI
ncbi:hypothetical protein GCM10010390_91730 [Streptomyces mordarskii]|uniref:Uncharacterized protein n=1 Tax=Streptomyces mordarskii TaxID=1226758 RepID=A0ABN1EV36_9ACTN